MSGRSSDRSGTRPRGGVSAAYATCSDFPLAAGGTDSSGELFVIGDGSWGSDVSEAARVTKREVTSGGGGGSERESSGGIGFQGIGNATLLESLCNESGYGSEPGYRGDGELGYDDELEEDEDDCKHLFWGEEIGGINHHNRFLPFSYLNICLLENNLVIKVGKDLFYLSEAITDADIFLKTLYHHLKFILNELNLPVSLNIPSFICVLTLVHHLGLTFSS